VRWWTALVENSKTGRGFLQTQVLSFHCLFGPSSSRCVGGASWPPATAAHVSTWHAARSVVLQRSSQTPCAAVNCLDCSAVTSVSQATRLTRIAMPPGTNTDTRQGSRDRHLSGRCGGGSGEAMNTCRLQYAVIRHLAFHGNLCHVAMLGLMPHK
ncbi:uncharacterized protein CCOS01_02720, partial [Colletotrichum costaricense]